ncbi:rhamnan synthesis F family protein [Nitrosomonas sp. Nm33]|uniref:rhamnan synthesis F family protein n=1 Tax=Nitrosomonas sp. Nm33 TaxID=133724 RepID=UPI000899C182|nr:rhamnan synthesis F family protein [Nitrosomonas sp. Nm33]SDZ12608.1 rhamnosyltransferase [Nitrosomonas sp. Nm33]
MKTSAFWHTKKIVEDLRFLRDTSVYMIAKRAAYEKPIVRYSERGYLAPNYDRPVCFFCGYDEKNIIKKNVYRYLNELMQAGFDIVFISSNEIVSDADLEKLSKFCIRIIVKENRGYDFYGWKIGLQEYPQYHSHSALLLANDSVLGPLFSIHKIIARLENDDADIVGMTDSLHFLPHLQSYFLYCKKSVMVSEEFTDFFSRVEVLGFKMAIVKKYEIGFSRLLGRRFKLSALYSLDSILNRIHCTDRPKNWIDATVYLWKPLVTEFKFPFLKKNLLIKKGVSIEEISEVLARSDSNYTVDMLAEY